MTGPNALRPRRWLRSLGYGLLLLAWLFVMTVPCLAFALAARGELSWERSDHDWDRIWLIQERTERGIGYQAERLLSDQSATGGPICIRNSVRYYLWQGATSGSDSDYCECLAADGAAAGTPCP